MKKSGKCLRRVEGAAEQYVKRWFVKEKKNVAKRRALEVQSAQQLKTPLAPTAGGAGRGAALKEA